LCFFIKYCKKRKLKIKAKKKKTWVASQEALFQGQELDPTYMLGPNQSVCGH